MCVPSRTTQSTAPSGWPVADFGARLATVFADRGQLCLGIDPHAFLLSEWGLPDDTSGVRELALRAIDEASDVIGIVKPQVAFFERHGAQGYIVLEEVLAAARAAGLVVIADVKRGDVGSTVAAYGEAWLTPGSSLEADAMTISAYQGLGSISEPIARAHEYGKGVFVLAATSNPEATPTQTALVQRGEFAGESVAAGIVAGVDHLNAHADQLGSVGVVLGATVDLADYGIDGGRLGRTPILAPGFGEQGAQLSDLARLYGDVSSHVIANVGRSVLRAGAEGLGAELRRQSDELRKATGR